MHYCYSIVVIFFFVAYSLQSTDVTYAELEDLDATCNMLDTCNTTRELDSLDIYTCHCNSFCSKLRTCCVDSPYRDIKQPGRRPNCRTVTGNAKLHYYMVDVCSSTRNQDEEMERLCKEEFEEHDTITPMLPVTSLVSNVTYKNYYCFRCNERTNNFLYWNLIVNADSKSDDVQAEDVVPVYDNVRKTWMASVGEGGVSTPVFLSIDIPKEIYNLPKVCTPSIISTCSKNWRLRDVRRKCRKYTAFIYIVNNGTNVRYRNPHCALCNFESLDEMGCGVKSARTGDKRPFPFSLLLDLNRSDRDKVIQICDDESVWDTFFKRCRKFVCLLPRQVVKKGKCVPP